MRQRVFARHWAWVCTWLGILVLATACGRGSSSGDASSGGGPPVVATMPPAKFTAVAQQAAAASSVLTQSTVLTQPVTADVDAQQLERGANIYINRKCVECHGEQAEGVPDKGAALASTQLSRQEFVDTLRTGGNGELGPDHLYGPSAVSPAGVEALYAWLQSLPAQ